jgi:hypothetical protein
MHFLGNNCKADIQNCSELVLPVILLPEISDLLQGYRKCINEFHFEERQLVFQARIFWRPEILTQKLASLWVHNVVIVEFYRLYKSWR